MGREGGRESYDKQGSFVLNAHRSSFRKIVQVWESTANIRRSDMKVRVQQQGGRRHPRRPSVWHGIVTSLLQHLLTFISWGVTLQQQQHT